MCVLVRFVDFLTKNDRRNANKSRVNLLSICFCVALALVSHSFMDKRKWQIAFTTDACSESRENNCFHATITGWRSQLTFGFEKGRQSGRLSRPRTPNNTPSETQSRQGLLPALFLDWLDNCRLLHLYPLQVIHLPVTEHENLAVIGFSREQRALWKVFPKSLSCSLPGTNG